jgi:hypothetical protein
VLTAENLRSELLELWQNKTIPTKAIFLVTHNIEEAVLLADRIIVLGRNPGVVRTDFKVTLPHPRDRKSAAFTQLVDYIYKVLTQPGEQPPALPTAPAGGKPREPPRRTTRSCPTRVPAASPACWSCCSTTTARTTSTASRTTSDSRSTTCCPSWTPRACWASSP